MVFQYQFQTIGVCLFIIEKIRKGNEGNPREELDISNKSKSCFAKSPYNIQLSEYLTFVEWIAEFASPSLLDIACITSSIRHGLGHFLAKMIILFAHIFEQHVIDYYKYIRLRIKVWATT